MLQHLLIKDLAVVAFADIVLSSGMTVITGETGAGKSILLDALQLALGERSDSQLIRPGSEKAEIAACFDISSLPGAILWLSDLELTADTPQQCIIRRILFQNGRSKAFINGRPATTGQLRLLGEHLVQIHGQHQHQLLLKPQEQLRLLDAFGQHDALLSQVKTAYKEWDKLQQRLFQLKNNTFDQAKWDLLQYQISEIESLNLSENELSALYSEHDQLANAQTFIQACEEALGALQGDEESNAHLSIHRAKQSLGALFEKNPTLNNAKLCLENALIQLDEAVGEINYFLNQLEINPQRLSFIEDRLRIIHDVARKHKVEATALFSHFQQLKEQAWKFSHQEELMAQLKKDCELAEKHYQQVAGQLTKKRLETAKHLSKEVSQCIQNLCMPGAVFHIELLAHDDNTLHATGNESCQFNISANPGLPPQPLTKVASGGELSRVSLAIELITARFLATPTLIFDEVDVGISGKIGAVVGKALHDLSKFSQVLCVTHLPQVAAVGDHHLQVTKIQQEKTTSSEIHSLTGSDRIEEIARMLGGMNVTKQARANAKQLLQGVEAEAVE